MTAPPRLYQAHAWDPLTPIAETLRFFDDAVQADKVQYVRVSNFIGWQLQKATLLTRPPRPGADRDAAAPAQPAAAEHRA